MTPEMAMELSKITERVVRGNWNSTNPPSSPPPTDTAEKLYLQIRICGEQYTGSKYVKKEYQIELPANVVGLGGEAMLSQLDYSSGTWVQLAIPVILREPSSDLPEEATPVAPSTQPTDSGWMETNRWEKDGKTYVRSDRFTSA